MHASFKIWTKVYSAVLAVLAPAVYRERRQSLAQRLLQLAIKKP